MGQCFVFLVAAANFHQNEYSLLILVASAIFQLTVFPKLTVSTVIFQTNYFYSVVLVAAAILQQIECSLLSLMAVAIPQTDCF
jgi:hypothetical protein